MACMISTIALSSLGVGFSLAWYTSSRNLSIKTIDVSLRTDRDLKISDSPSLDSFVEHTYQKDDSGNYIDTSLPLTSSIKGDFKPISSMYSFKENWHADDTTYSWMERKESTPVFADSYSTCSTKVPFQPLKATSGYFSQELYFLSNDDCYVTLDPTACYFNGYIATSSGMELVNSQVKDAIHQQNLKAAKKLYEKTEDNDVEKWATNMDDLIKSLRISILVPDEEDYQYTIIDPFKEKDEDGNDVDTYFGGRLNSDTDDYFDYYIDDDDTKKEVFYGDIDETTRENIVYDKLVTTDTSSSGKIIDAYEKSSFTAYTKKDTCPVNFTSSINNGVKVAKEHSYALCDQGYSNSDLMIPVKKGVVKKIVLSIYLEGWDTDCINNTMGASFLSTLCFKIAREM